MSKTTRYSSKVRERAVRPVFERRTIANRRNQPWRPDSNKSISGKAAAIPHAKRTGSVFPRTIWPSLQGNCAGWITLNVGLAMAPSFRRTCACSAQHDGHSYILSISQELSVTSRPYRFLKDLK